MSLPVSVFVFYFVSFILINSLITSFWAYNTVKFFVVCVTIRQFSTTSYSTPVLQNSTNPFHHKLLLFFQDRLR